jgi:predicted nucleotidyltransferase
MADTKQAIDRLVRQIVEAVHPLKIVLFGSAARGDAGRNCDLDVLVVMPDGTKRLQTAKSLYRRIHGVGVPYDIIVATPTILARHKDTVGLVSREILREGVTLYAA